LIESIKKIFKKEYYKGLFKKKVVKDFSAVAGLDIALKPIQLVKSFIVAKYLGPAEYGLLATVQLITMLNKYGSLGFNNAASREVGNAIGKRDFEKVELIKSTAYSSELILSCILFIVGLTSSLFVDSRVVSVLIVLASAGLLMAKVRAILATEAAINKRFILTSKITFISSLIGSLIIIVTVPFLKIYAVLLTNIFISILAIIFFRKYLNFRFSFKINLAELKRILSISIPLTIGTLAQGSFKYAERILIISFLSTEVLGYFSFGVTIVGTFSQVLKVGIRVRIQDIYEGLGKYQYKRIHGLVLKETLLLTLFSAIMIPIVWILLDIFVPIFLEKWSNGVFSAQLYLFMLPFEILLLYPGTVLTSALVNKQNIIPFLRFGITGILVLSTLVLNYMNVLTINNFIVLNVLCIALYNIAILIMYKIYFYNKYVVCQN
jgi:O-antigen/teichoic acid export membrane protein